VRVDNKMSVIIDKGGNDLITGDSKTGDSGKGIIIEDVCELDGGRLCVDGMNM